MNLESTVQSEPTRTDSNKQMISTILINCLLTTIGCILINVKCEPILSLIDNIDQTSLMYSLNN